MYCTNCGHANPENSRYCEQCGTPLQASQQTPPSGQQYPPIPPGGGYRPPIATPKTPIWLLVSVIAGAATILGFILPWMSVGVFGYGVKASGLTFIFSIFRLTSSGIFGWLDGGQVFLLIVAFLIITAILAVIAVMAVKIIIAGVKLLGNHAILASEENQTAAKIKRYSITGLIAIGIYFFLVMVVVGAIMTDGLFSMNTLAFGFWLCLIGFAAALLGATVVKQRY